MILTPPSICTSLFSFLSHLVLPLYASPFLHLSISLTTYPSLHHPLPFYQCVPHHYTHSPLFFIINKFFTPPHSLHIIFTVGYLRWHVLKRYTCTCAGIYIYIYIRYTCMYTSSFAVRCVYNVTLITLLFTHQYTNIII